ncbi:hypothetical protein [Corynebacterium kalidii]
MTSPTTNHTTSQTGDYTAYVSADGAGWMIDIPALSRVTYAAHLRDVEDTALDLIAIMTGSTPSASDLTIAWPEEIESALTTINSAKQQAELAQQRAMDTMADAVVQLKSSGQSYRDIGAVLGVSHQRVAQLLNSRKPAAEHSADVGQQDHAARSA